MAPAVLCPACSTVVPGGAAACPSCGATLGIDEQPTRISHVTDTLRGAKLGDYVVGDRIGMGGMGIVYRAHHPLIGNSVAIKVLRPDIISSEFDMQRFLGEARAVNQVRHRGVVSIFGAGDTPDGRKYLVMELLEGEALETRLQREGKLPAAELIPILDEVLAALEAVHAAGVVHRDLKPANVFLARESHGKVYVKLLDFGLARRSNNLEVSRVAGTPDYISPEHARGKPPGPAADMYSLGAMAFHLLTGRVPFPGSTAVAVMEQHVSAPPPNPGLLDGSIPVAMCELVMKLMAKEPSLRPMPAVVRADLEAAGRQLRAAATQLALPVMSAPGERPTQPGLAAQQTPVPARDTEPQLGAQGPVILAPPSSRDTDPWKAAPTPIVERPAVALDTAPELPRRRWPVLVAAAGLLVIAGLSVKVVLDSREPEPASPPFDGRRPLPNLAELPEEAPVPDEPETAAPPEPTEAQQPGASAPAPAVVKKPGKRDWRVDLRARLEKAQHQAEQQSSDTYAALAKTYLARLDKAAEKDQAGLEEKTAQLENRLQRAK